MPSFVPYLCYFFECQTSLVIALQKQFQSLISSKVILINIQVKIFTSVVIKDLLVKKYGQLV